MLADGDPDPEEYALALAGKHVLIPLAMGFDLAQSWASIVGREVEAFGGTYETRDPNWYTEAGAQEFTEAISSSPRPDVLAVMAPDLNSFTCFLEKARAAGNYVILIDNPANFDADVYIGSDWTRLGSLEAEAAVRAPRAKSALCRATR